MIRVIALTVVLTLAGTPAATAACLVWCSSPCSEPMQQDGTIVSASQTSCENLLIGAPILREESRRERQAPSVAYLAGPPLRITGFDLEYMGVPFLAARDHAPPGHQKPPTVLRL